MRVVGVMTVLVLAVLCFADEIDDLLAKLGAEDWNERETASKALAEKGSSVIPRLLEAYGKTEDSEIKLRINLILKQLGHPTAEALADIDKYLSEYQKLVEAPLTKEEFTKQTQALVEQMKKIENAATHLAARLGDAKDENLSLALAFFLKAMLGDETDEGFGGGTSVVERGGQVIVRVGAKKIVMGGGGGEEEEEEGLEGQTPAKVLLDMAKTGNESLKEAALKALAKRKELVAVKELIETLSAPPEEDDNLQRMLRRQLRKANPPADEEAEKKEAEKRKEKEKQLKLRLAAALRELTGQSFGPDDKTQESDFVTEIGKWQDWWKTAKDAAEYKEAKLKEQMLVLRLKEANIKRQLRAYEKKKEELMKALDDLKNPKESPYEKQQEEGK
jgi:hypothetical protein